MRKRLWSGLAMVLALVVPAAADAPDIVITGDPASSDFVRETLHRHGVDTSVRLTDLAPGQQVDVGDVRVVNRPLPTLPPAVLGFSDHPEKVADTGVLFWGGLLAWRPVRLQYYHEGAPGQPSHVLSLFLDDPGTTPVTVHVVAGTAGPKANPLDAGHVSGREFLRHLTADEGEVLTLAAGETRELFTHALAPGQTVSGLVQMTLLTPGQVHYHVVSRNTESEPVSFPTLDNPADVHAKGAFTVTEVHATRSYRTGAPDGWLSVGNHAPDNVLRGKSLAGDYGITYSLTLHMVNATDSAATVGLFFQPRGGSAAGSFVVDRRLVEAGVTAAKAVQPLSTYVIPPGKTVSTQVVTIPEGASSYPVRLLWRTLPQPGAYTAPRQR